MARQTIEQERARKAFNKIQEVKSQEYNKDYLSYVRSASALITTNGLLQTLAFWDSKATNAHKKILEHLDYLVLDTNEGRNALLNICKDKDTGATQYRQITKLTLAVLVWLKRFAEAEIN